MKRRILFLLAVVMAAAFLLSGCGQNKGYIDFSKPQEAPVVEEQGEHPLRIAFAAVMSPKETRQSYQAVVDYIAGQLGEPVVLVQRRTYEELNGLVANGDADIAFLSTGAYSAYRGKVPIELLAMVQTNGTVMYNTYVIVPSDSHIEDMDGLEGGVFAFTDPISYSGKLAVSFYLSDRMTSSEKFFRRFYYTYSHDKSIWAVANHLADGASVDSQIYVYMASVNASLVEKTRIVEVLPSAPTGPVVMRSDLDPEKKETLRRLFYQMNTVPRLEEPLKRVVIDKFVPPDAKMYQDLRNHYSRILMMEEGGVP